MTAGAKAAKAAMERNSASDVSADEKTVTVDITAAEAATNGVVSVTWDTEALEYVGCVSTAAYTSRVEADGSLTFGYVSLAAIEAGDAIVTLEFKAKTTEDTVITVEHKQLNNTSAAAEEVLVEFTHANTEVRDTIAATCTTAGYTGDTYCTDCGKLIAKGTIIEALGHSYEAVVTEPTCTTDGYTTYTCSVCGHSYTADYVEATCPSAAFSDVPVDAWFHEAVDYVAENGLMAGISANLFAPGAELNRAQIVTILYRMAGCPEVTDPAAFADVPVDSYCASAVAWASANGITSGVSANLFNPTGIVNRAQMVTFLYKYMELSGADVSVTGDLSAYTDAADVPNWAVVPMTWAVENGIISGTEADTLSPAMNCNRAQMAVVLMAIAN